LSRVNISRSTAAEAVKEVGIWLDEVICADLHVAGQIVLPDEFDELDG
jgi:hypothetical protein